MEERTAVLFVAHYIDDELITRYRKLKEELSPLVYDVIWVMATNMDDIPVFPIDIRHKVYVPVNFTHTGYTPIEPTMHPGSCHFIALCFFKDYPRYSHYWFVEYDVYFTGKWSVLMNDCDTALRSYDFLSCHIEKFDNMVNRQWAWWYRSNNCGYPIIECIKGFNPICRYSAKALEYIDKYQKQGYSAHSEVMITTCLYHESLSLADIGGTGEFTPKEYRNKFYVQGVGTNNGTIRWRPSFTKEEIEALGTKEKLFHPVK
ncbi:MAG: hypothetical protein NC206_02530 [Bacteroides sp.]|nr:hypothetical protein [Roseburia sp.]MCM1345939.1 hypothetical protein [Bacteroides sp.]MCM1420303.1 hypothetical protein [Bacteroides sp.]